MNQCSQLMHSKEVRAGHVETWPVAQLAKKEVHYAATSPSRAMATNAVVVIPVLGTGAPFSQHLL